MSADHREKLTALMATHGIGEAHYEHRESGLRISVGGTAKAAEPRSAPALKAMIHAPQAGLFRNRHPLASAAKASDGPRRVTAGEIIAYLQIGALLRPVIAPKDGVVGLAMVEDGALTGYRSPLFAYL